MLDSRGAASQRLLRAVAPLHGTSLSLEPHHLVDSRREEAATAETRSPVLHLPSRSDPQQPAITCRSGSHRTPPPLEERRVRGLGGQLKPPGGRTEYLLWTHIFP